MMLLLLVSIVDDLTTNYQRWGYSPDALTNPTVKFIFPSFSISTLRQETLQQHLDRKRVLLIRQLFRVSPVNCLDMRSPSEFVFPP